MENLPLDKKHFRVVAYGRVSTNHLEQLDALENQVQWYKDFVAARPNWELVELYIDEGVTGTSVKNRTNFNRMLEDARLGKFDLAISRDASRWARNLVDAIQYTRELKSIGVATYFINDNILISDSANDDELRLSLMSMLSQEESRKTSIRVKAGQSISMKNGVIYGTGNILGYKKEGNNFVLDKEQAETVRMIYDMYLAGTGMRGIKNELEKKGRLTATGNKNWSTTTISYVLRNSFYAGTIVYHKQFVPDFLKQEVRKKNTGQIEQIVVQGTHETIVTVEEKSKKDAPRGDKKPKPMWSNLLVCGDCGKRFVRIESHPERKRGDFIYQCSRQNSTGTIKTREKKGLSTEGICDVPCIPEWKLVLMAEYLFTELLVHDDHYLSELKKDSEIAAKMLMNAVTVDFGNADPTKGLSDQLENEKKQLEKLEKRLDGLVEMAAEGDIAIDYFREKKKETEAGIRDARKKITETENRIKEITKKDNEKIEAEEECAFDNINDCNDLAENIYAYLLHMELFNRDGSFKTEMVKSYIDRITVKKDRLYWHLKFDDDKDQGKTIDLSDFKKKPVVDSDSRKNECPGFVSCGTGRYRPTKAKVIYERIFTLDVCKQYLEKHPEYKFVIRNWTDIQLSIVV